MRVFHPDEHTPVMHASTFSGNPLSLAAGHAAMDQLDRSSIAHVHGLGEQFRRGANETFARHGIRGQAIGLGSLSNLHLTDAPLPDARASLDGMILAGEISTLLHLSMLQRGVASASRLMYCTSTAMGPEDVATAIDALDDALTELGPGIERERPGLLLD